MKNESFECNNCGNLVSKHPEGSARNHCPYCLHSLHLDDIKPGDRASKCGGIMQPIDIDFKKNKGNMILHSCNSCGKKILNKIAPDDNFLEFIKKRNKNL